MSLNVSLISLKAKVHKGLIGIVDKGSSYEFVALKRKGLVLEEITQKNKRLWLITNKYHLKYSPQFRTFLVLLSGEKSVTIDSGLIELIKAGWKDGIRHQKDLMLEFVDRWETDENGKEYPVFKEELQFYGVSISSEHLSEVLKTFSPELLYSYIENEVSARVRTRVYGLEAKTFITVFIAVLLAVVIAWLIIKSNAINPQMIGNAVKSVINAQTPTNATITPI